MAQINFNDKNAGDFLTPGDVNSIKNTIETVKNINDIGLVFFESHESDDISALCLADISFSNDSSCS